MLKSASEEVELVIITSRDLVLEAHFKLLVKEGTEFTSLGIEMRTFRIIDSHLTLGMLGQVIIILKTIFMCFRNSVA